METDSEVLEMEVMPDHVHLLIEVDPQYGINRFVKQAKGRSSHQLRQEFPWLKTKEAKAPIDPLAEWARLHQRIAKTYIGYKSREKLNQYAIEFADRKKVTVAIAVLTCFSVR